jgi:hypothetical protein
MEQLKPSAIFTEPDIRNTYPVLIYATSQYRKLTFEEFYADVAAISLIDSVPDSIRSHFSQAQNLAAYSWFHFPFNVTAQFLGFVSVEFALKLRFKSDASFKHLIKKAVAEGLVIDTGFTVAANRDPSIDSYVDVLIDVLPNLRNKLAHGSDMLHRNGVQSLRTCAEFINQLFPSKKSQ